MTGTPRRVLLVEDHRLVAEAMTILLESGGHLVRWAGTLAEALELSRTWRPAILLLDLTLPDGNGLELLRQLSEGGAMPPIAVALTGHDDEELARRCRAAGCVDVLLKPVPARTLLAQMERWAEQARDRGTDPTSA